MIDGKDRVRSEGWFTPELDAEIERQLHAGGGPAMPAGLAGRECVAPPKVVGNADWWEEWRARKRARGEWVGD